MEDNAQSKCYSERRGVAIHISDKIDFKTKMLTRDKDGLLIMIKSIIQQEVITFLAYMHQNILSNY